MDEKTCPKCGQKYPINQEFVVCRNPIDNIVFVCPGCRIKEDLAHEAKQKGAPCWGLR